MSWLLDGNVLCALVIDTHVHHAAAHDWWAENRGPFATCTVTQGTLLRVMMATAIDRSAARAWQALREIEALPEHSFWKDGFSYSRVDHKHLQGHRQVTDAWLAELARRRKGRLVTFDSGLAALHKDIVLLIHGRA